MEFEIRPTDDPRPGHEMGIYLCGVDLYDEDSTAFVASYSEGHDEWGRMYASVTVYDTAILLVYKGGTMPLSMISAMRAFRACIRSRNPDYLTYYEGDYSRRHFLKTVECRP